jgi:hypothetical protein
MYRGSLSMGSQNIFSNREHLPPAFPFFGRFLYHNSFAPVNFFLCVFGGTFLKERSGNLLRHKNLCQLSNCHPKSSLTL